MQEISDIFTQTGGTFLVPADEIAIALTNIKAFIFDWDGVFNNGSKSFEKGSEYSEPDAMGINMLRFNYWLMHKKVPPAFIITGANNTTAIEMAKRDNFNAVYLKFLNKRIALQNISENYGIAYNEMAFIFDDILDVDAVKKCKLAFCVRRNASPMFTKYVIENKICQYITGHEGGSHAIREITELLIALTGNYNNTIGKRIEFGDDYVQYLADKKLIKTEIATFNI